ncbi:unnamed protein product [Periconia digitata]|uniref:F-box domain-containing protein n=1 Tax=Periconia digitata TaxID=1303443 RepID=A0A9W4US42_9PLEO|nr:unnamed protein product [Periconia digitata]
MEIPPDIIPCLQLIRGMEVLPESPAKLPVTLHNLPTELLLHIASYLVHTRHWNASLRSLSLVCRSLRPIAQEILIINPQLHTSYIPLYIHNVLEYGHRLRYQVKTVELESSLHEDVRERCGGHRTDPPATSRRDAALLSWIEAIQDPDRIKNPQRQFHLLMKGCIERDRVDNLSTNSILMDDRSNRGKNIDTFIVPILVLFLINMFDNLRELKLAGCVVQHFPFILEFEPNIDRGGRILRTEVFRKMKKLENLEWPGKLGFRTSIDARTRQIYHRFNIWTSVKVFSVPMWMLRVWGSPIANWLPGVPLQNILPAGLVCLRITEAECVIGRLVTNLCIACKNGHLSQLRRLEIYFKGCIDRERFLASVLRYPDPWISIPQMCADANLELLLCSPGPWKPCDIQYDVLGGTVWSLREQGELGPAVVPEEVFRANSFCKADYVTGWGYTGIDLRIEREWDADGDIVMQS